MFGKTNENSLMALGSVRQGLFLALFSLVLLVGSLTMPSALLAQHDVQKFHHSETSPKVDYAGQFAAAESLAESPAGQQVLADCLAAYGGRDALAAVRGARLTYNAPNHQEGDLPQMVKSFACGRRYKVVSSGKSRVMDGERCWVTRGEDVYEADEFRYRAELFSYLTMSMPLAAEIEEFTDIRFGAGVDEELEYLYFAKADSMLMILGLDREDHLIRTTTGVLPTEEMDMIYINNFFDFKTVESLVFPHRVEFLSLGMSMGQVLLDDVELNPNFAADEFSLQTESQ